jgi:hypothetical protein
VNRKKDKRSNAKSNRETKQQPAQQLFSSEHVARRFETHERICEFILIFCGLLLGGMSAFSSHKLAIVWTTGIGLCAAILAVLFWYTDRELTRRVADVTTSSNNPTAITPDSQPRPKTWRPVPDDKFLLILGDFLAWKSGLPMVALMQREEPLIVLNEEPTGMSLSANFFNAEGKIVAEIDRNEIHPNPEKFWRLKKTAHRLTVFNDEAKVVMDVQFLNPLTVKIVGQFFARNGVPVVLSEDGIQLGASYLVESGAGECGGAALSIP